MEELAFLFALCIFTASGWMLAQKCSWKRRRSHVNTNWRPLVISPLCCPRVTWLSLFDLPLAAYRWQWECFSSSLSFSLMEMTDHSRARCVWMKPTQQQCYAHFQSLSILTGFLYDLYQDFISCITPSPSHSFLGEHLSTIVKNSKKTPSTYCYDPT